MWAYKFNKAERRWECRTTCIPAAALQPRRLVSVQEVKCGGHRDEPTNLIATELVEATFLPMGGERRVSVISVD